MAFETPVLRGLEAAEYLRLTEDHRSEGDAVNALHRLVRKCGLRPIGNLRPYRFAKSELDRWIADQTAEFGAKRTGGAE